MTIVAAGAMAGIGTEALKPARLSPTGVSADVDEIEAAAGALHDHLLGKDHSSL